jgi:DNA helicase-4
MSEAPLKPRTWRPTRLGAFFCRSGRWTIDVQDEFVECRSTKRSLQIPLTELSRVELKTGLIWSKVTLVTPADNFLVAGSPNATAREMSRDLRRASIAARISVLEDHEGPLLSWASSVENVFGLTHWITLEETEDLWASRPASSAFGFNLDEFIRDLGEFTDLEIGMSEAVREALSLTPSGLGGNAEAHNQHFAERESIEYASFFRTVEKSPLNRAQIRACICFDSRVLTVAAAGSGKTSTMIAKAGYALISEIVRSDEILMLAFNADAAKELRQRAAERLGELGVEAEKVNAKTFHKLGLDIIGQATGRKPRVAPWLTQGQDVEAVAEIIADLSQTDPKFRVAWILFRTVFSRNLSGFDEEAEADYWDSATSRAGFRTMQGEVVKSEEERLIADWLFVNGVNYEYERPYEVDTVTPEHGQYQPDFFYPDVQVYHEHFALDESGNPPERFGKEYLEGVRWKRAIHEEHGTTLIETTSFGVRNGDDLGRLQAELEALGIPFEPDADRTISGRTPPPDVEVARIFRVFLIHAKSNRLSIDDLRSRLGAIGGKAFRMRQNTFLFLYEKIAAEWDRRLRAGEYVDFEDMLNLATELVSRGKWKSPFRLVMVDEFQDVSKSRVELAKVLVSGRGRFLFAVGDDWQAINRFAGADVTLMSRFRETFGPARKLTLQETFRSPQPLCDIASDFVLRNPTQIRKKVISAQPVFGAPVQVYPCEDSSRETLLEKHLQALYDKVGRPEHPTGADGTVSALLLGRYNHELPSRMKQWRDGFGDRIRLDFLTIHSAKGLEADYVFIVKMSSGRYSFPSKIEDDPILLLAMPDADDHPFAEERRLFYVALTRARRMVVIYTDERMPSEFLGELRADERVTFAGDPKRTCPACNNGSLVRREGPRSEFLGCSRFPRCRYTKPIDGIPASSQ